LGQLLTIDLLEDKRQEIVRKIKIAEKDEEMCSKKSAKSSKMIAALKDARKEKVSNSTSNFTHISLSLTVLERTV
jgi:hypothetical protein